MRILYVTESMKWSGGAQQLLWMSGALRRRGHDLTLVCQPGSDLVERARVLAIPTEFVRMRQDYDLPAALAIAKIVRRRKTELLHAQHSTAHALALVAAYLSKVRAFAVTRRVLFPMRRNLFSRLKYLVSRINGYVAISSAVKHELLRAGIEEARIEVIPSVIHVEPVRKNEGDSVRTELRISPDAPVVTNVANYADFKGQDVLLRAAVEVVRAVPSTIFLFVGRDVEQLAPLVAQLGLATSVRLAGFRSDIPRVLAATTLFVLPSRQEAAGTAVREAMALGLPCIASDVGGVAEAVMQEQTGLLVPAGDVAALSTAILRLLRNPAEAERFAAAGRQLVEARFSLPAAALRMESFYRRLLA